MKKGSSFFTTAFRFSFLCLFSFICCFSTYLQAVCTCPPSTDCPEQMLPPGGCMMPSAMSYMLRYAITGEHGAMSFIGNTLGLSKAPCLNQPGVSDSIGAFTTIDPTQMVGTFPSIAAMSTGGPAGTTLNWLENASSAVLNLPAGATILYAELIWSGSYGYYCDAPTSGSPEGVDPNCILNFANGPIKLITPDNVVHMVIADPATAMISQNPAPDVQPFYCAGNYTRSADVSSLFLAPSLSNPNGTYIVSGVPATVSGLDDTHNAAGWTLAIVYRYNTTEINNMSLFIGAQQASRAGIVAPAEVTGFCAPGTSGQTARLLVSAVEADANKTGDQMKFGPTVAGLTALSGPNNPVDNFFASQINDDSGNLINTTGTFCTVNANPFTQMLVNGGRQGYDITNVDCSATIVPNQMTAFALGTTDGDDYMINAIGIQIGVNSPVLVPTKQVNGQLWINSEIGDTVTFTFSMTNTGSDNAFNVSFQDSLEPGLMFMSGSFMIDAGPSIPFTAAQLQNGIPIGNVNIGQTVNITCDVKIVGVPLSGNTFVNFGTVSFDFLSCSTSTPFTNSNPSNVIMITLPTETFPGPAGNVFNGFLEKCKFLNKNRYTLTATWGPSSLPTVVSYEILKNGKVVSTIPPEGPYVFETCLHSKKEAQEFSIVVVYPNNYQSVPVNIRITDE